jgi:ABC-type branched-subunit amino acid transport system ATPase component/ABC-type branched-subunit amino acid transport system permease subunit
MREFITFALFGLASGALTSLVALGVVVVYRASGVVNFSASALGAIGAYVCYALTNDGVPSGLAIVVGLLVGAALGAATYLAMRLLRNSSLLAKLMVTLGLFTSAQAFILLVWGAVVTSPAGFLPTRGFSLGGPVKIGEDRLILLVGALLLGGILIYVYTRTMFGLATAAVSESRRFAASSAWSPAVIELVNFTVSGILAALAAIFLAPIVGLSGAVLAAVILPALASALVGRFTSFGTTIVAALVIGVGESEISNYLNDIANWVHVSALSLSGLPDAVPLALIVILITARGRTRLQRGETQALLPLTGNGRISLVPLAIGAVATVALLFGAGSWADAVIATVAGGIIVLSVVVVTGYAGQLSLCQFALAGFGGWAAAKLASASGLPFLLALLFGVVCAIALGLAVAIPAARARGMSLAVATLALALLLNAIIFTNGSLTGGFNGVLVNTPTIFGLSLDPIAYPARYGAFGLVLFVIAGLLVANIRRGRSGRRLLAIKSDEQAAASLGIGVYGAKLYAFGLAAGLAGLAGGYLAFQFPSASFSNYDAVSSVSAVQYTVIGGLGWPSGAPIGGALGPGGLVSQLVNDTLGNISQINTWVEFVTGLLLIVILRTSPDGIASVWATAFNQPGAAAERQALRVSRVLWQVLGLIELLAGICLVIGLAATPLEYAGAIAVAAVMGLRLALEFRSGQPQRRRQLTAAAGLVTAIVVLVLRIVDVPLALFILSQVLAFPVLNQACSKLSRKLLDRFTLPRPGSATPAPRRARTPMSLELDQVSVRFGGVLALDEVSVSVRAGEVVGLIGPNGAGKTTLLDVASGFTQPTSGRRLLDGKPADKWSPERSARSGLIRSWQGVGLFKSMTIRENLEVAADRQQARHFFTDLVRPGRSFTTQAMAEVIEEFGLHDILDRLPAALSQGMTRLAGIARAVVAEPRVLLLDEPAAGLDVAESAEFARVIRRVADRYGIGILVVEHDVPLVMGLCDRIVVLDFGRVIAEGPPETVASDPKVVAAYLGDSGAAELTAAPAETNRVRSGG